MEKNQKKCNLALWTIIYLLPLIIYCIQSLNGTPDLVQLINVHGVYYTNFIYQTILNVFSVLNIEFITSNSAILLYLTYFVVCNLIHIIVDLLVLLPRIAQSFADKIHNSGD